MSGASPHAEAASLAAAYEFCRAVARREAKNFYYAFRVLPKHKSDAMCVMYAFMRKADDLADDESMPLEQRRAAMAEWTTSWRASRIAPTSDPVFLALADTQRRFGISDELLEQLVRGTTLDLEEEQPGVGHYVSETIDKNGVTTEVAEADVYNTFDDLYRYCYLVASVVGLVTIRIFGYTDARAEQLAERTGIAFQLTNILRDVKEDAERGRIYLPRDDMARTGANESLIFDAVRGRGAAKEVRQLLRLEIDRANAYYASADELIPLLDADSRPAMRVLVEIYRDLLLKIATNTQAVFTRRVSLSTHHKLAILLRGLASSLFTRSGK